MSVFCCTTLSSKLTTAVLPPKLTSALWTPAVSSSVSLMSPAQESQCIPSMCSSAFTLVSLPPRQSPRGPRAEEGAARPFAGVNFCLASVAAYYSPAPRAQATRARVRKGLMNELTDESSGTEVTFAEALREASAALRVAGLQEPRREAATLLTHATGRDRAFLLTHADERLTTGELSDFRGAVARRAAGEPFQYIAGRQEFYGLDFEVTPDVLIPRPETELLVETALELLKDTQSPFICDVGT